jgi:membrane protease subunit HflK
MAWNTPGSGSNGSKDKPSPWKPKGKGGGNDFSAWADRLRGLFDGNGGGNPLRWVAIAVVLLLVFSSFQLIGEQQRGVVLRFGQFSRILQPGPNFKLPWPIESVTKVNATQIKTFSSEVPVLTRDENIVRVSLNVQYRIDDPRLYLFGTVAADQVLEQSAQSAVREQVGRADLNAVLNNRGPLAVVAEQRLQAALKAYNTGLSVTGLTLPDARPPEEVKPAFDEVNGAQQVKERLDRKSVVVGKEC